MGLLSAPRNLQPHELRCTRAGTELNVNMRQTLGWMVCLGALVLGWGCGGGSTWEAPAIPGEFLVPPPVPGEEKDGTEAFDDADDDETPEATPAAAPAPETAPSATPDAPPAGDSAAPPAPPTTTTPGAQK